MRFLRTGTPGCPASVGPAWTRVAIFAAFLQLTVGIPCLAQSLLAFHGGHGREGHIYTYDLSTGELSNFSEPNLKPLHEGEVWGFTDARWSPNGSRIAYDNGGDLFVADLSRGTTTQIAGADRPSWAPDSHRLVCTRDSDLYVVDTNNLQVTQLTSTDARDGDPAWSPIGSQIAFSRESGERMDIWVLDTEGSTAARNLTEGIDAPFKMRPSWSPDGETLVFDIHADGVELDVERGIWRIESEGTDARYLGTGLLFDSNAAWSPDGSLIAFAHCCPAWPDHTRIGIAQSDGSDAFWLDLGELEFLDSPTWVLGDQTAAVVASDGWGALKREHADIQ